MMTYIGWVVITFIVGLVMFLAGVEFRDRDYENGIALTIIAIIISISGWVLMT